MLNAALWICQTLLAIVFGYSGATKSVKTEKELVAMGQTGVEGLPAPLIRFIGISEILGVVRRENSRQHFDFRASSRCRRNRNRLSASSRRY